MAPASPTACQRNVPAQSVALTKALSARAYHIRLSAGTRSASDWKLSGSILNVTNHRVLEDTSITIGGFHYNDPRLLSGELRYRFHFSKEKEIDSRSHIPVLIVKYF